MDNTDPLVQPIKSGMTPRKIIQFFTADVWEEFVVEWTEGFETPYHTVVNLGGAGDKGRDVIGYLGDPQSDCQWDNYQCKHYDHPLRPTDVYTELAKLCYYTFIGDYSVPRRYRFVAPRGVGTKLHDLLKNHGRLRAELYANWEDYCQKKITDTTDVALTIQMRAYIDAFDFSRVWFITPQDLLKQHQRTKYWHQRFKIEPPVRPKAPTPPAEVQDHELVYVSQLLSAYSQRTGKTLSKVTALSSEPEYHEHFRRARGAFFSAEALGRFSRDQFTGGAFVGLKEEIFHGVIDISMLEHKDGFSCLLETTRAAVALPLPESELKPYVGSTDRIGLCHHLANDSLLKWVKGKP